MEKQIIVEKLKDMIYQRGITQTELAKIAEMQFSRLNKIINNSDSSFFTVSQTIKIAEYFNISVDDFLCLGKKDTPNETLSDIENMIFQLDSPENNFELYTKVDIDFDESQKPQRNQSVMIFLNNERIQDFLKQYQQFIKTKDWDYGEEVFNTWKKVSLENGKRFIKEYGYQTDFEYHMEQSVDMAVDEIKGK